MQRHKVGSQVIRKIKGQYVLGRITNFNEGTNWYWIYYDDGDSEELTHEQAKRYLLLESIVGDIYPVAQWGRVQIVDPPLNYKEADLLNDRIKRTPYQVFLSTLVYELDENCRNARDKRTLLGLPLPLEEDNDDDDDDDDDNDDAFNYTLIRQEASNLWQTMSPAQKRLWQERADKVNSRSIPGILRVLPGGICDKETIQQFIRRDYVDVWRIF